MAVIKTPHTYSEWVVVFDALKNKSGDQAVIEAMYAGTIEWQTGVAERFTNRLIDAVNFRLNAATDKFQLDMKRAGAQDSGVIQALLGLRREMQFLSKAMNLPVIPEKDREKYYKLVLDHADAVQKSLEDSAKKDRTGKLSSIVRNHKVNSFTF